MPTAHRILTGIRRLRDRRRGAAWRVVYVGRSFWRMGFRRWQTILAHDVATIVPLSSATICRPEELGRADVYLKANEFRAASSRSVTGAVWCRKTGPSDRMQQDLGRASARWLGVHALICWLELPKDGDRAGAQTAGPSGCWLGQKSVHPRIFIPLVEVVPASRPPGKRFFAVSFYPASASSARGAQGNAGFVANRLQRAIRECC